MGHGGLRWEVWDMGYVIWGRIQDTGYRIQDTEFKVWDMDMDMVR